MRLVTLFVLASMLSGCGAVIAYRRMQIMDDQQALMSEYKQCVEAGQENCERFRAGENVNLYGAR